MLSVAIAFSQSKMAVLKTPGFFDTRPAPTHQERQIISR
jgi:hypothetical protein